jgi:outer membrane lipoprotein SlyB
VLSIQQETREGKASGLGAVGGAVIGGLLGNQIGGGNGKKIATVGGVVAGGMAGHEIEKHQKAQRVWVVRVKNSDGRSQTFVRESDPQFSVGDVLQLRDGQFQRQL